MISKAYRSLNARNHAEKEHWGRGAKHYVGIVRSLVEALKTNDVLDYGCGKGSLGEALGYSIKEYDPAIPAKSARPEPADIVVCASVLEHVEPDHVDDVLADLRRCTQRVGLFVIPHNSAVGTLPDGRNCHLSVHPWPWWQERLQSHGFIIDSTTETQSITCEKPGEIMLGSRTFCLIH